MKIIPLVALIGLAGCVREQPPCAGFRPSAPYDAPALSAADRSMLEVNGELSAFNAGLLCRDER